MGLVIAVRYKPVLLPAIVLALLLFSAVGTPAAVAIRGHRPPAHHHGAVHRHYPAHYHGYYRPYYGYQYYPYASFGFSFGYPSYGYPPYGYPYYPYAYGYGYGAPYYAGPPPDVGFIDTDVSPEKAQVFVDGQYVGTADDFDGYPRFLSLDPGEHTITFQAEGHHPATKTLSVTRGALLRFKMSLQKPGKKNSHPPKDDPEMIVPPPQPLPQNSGEGGAQGAVAVTSAAEGDDHEAPQGQPGTMKLHVVPGDASVYLDGEFIGTGDSLARLHGNLRLDPGRHVVEVARPGFRTAKKDINVRPGSHTPIEMLLQKD